MIKKALLLLAVAASTATPSHGATLVWQAVAGNNFDLFNGLDLPSGNLIRAGFFNLTDNEILLNSTSPAGIQFLNQNFTEFSVAHIGEGTGNTAGTFSNTDITTGALATSLAGKQIYIWAFASGDTSSDAARVTSATEHAIFYLPFAIDPEWRFPADPDLGSTSIAIRDMTDSATNTSLVAGARVVVGQLGPGTSGVTGKPNFTLAPVPEPSAALALLASVGLMAIRRRRA